MILMTISEWFVFADSKERRRSSGYLEAVHDFPFFALILTISYMTVALGHFLSSRQRLQASNSAWRTCYEAVVVRFISMYYIVICPVAPTWTLLNDGITQIVPLAGLRTACCYHGRSLKW
uniref:Uncharacterized protein n=1 Tax=Glossina pallidipes TaxID=7398 RepID=A0A1A9ZNM3_GLOPL